MAPAKTSNGTLRNLLIVLGGLAVIGVVALVVFGPKLLKAAEGHEGGGRGQGPGQLHQPGRRVPAPTCPDRRPREHQTTSDGTPMTMWGLGRRGQRPARDLGRPARRATRGRWSSRLLDAFIDGAVTGHGVTTTITFAGHTARRFSGTFDDFDGVGVVFVSGSRLYVLLAGGPWASKDPQAQAFLDSFQLTSPSDQPIQRLATQVLGMTLAMLPLRAGR